TPGIRASGPSFMKPLPPASRPDVSNIDEPPLAIVRTIANRQEIIAVSPAAANFGIRPGLTLTEGRALCGGLVAFDHDPLRDARALEALARWMMRFSPAVCLPVGATPASRRGAAANLSTLRVERDAGVAPTENLPDGDAIYLDLTGCERVFGGIDNIVRSVLDSLAHLRLGAGVAVAPTPGAAWAFASFPKPGHIVPRATLAAHI